MSQQSNDSAPNAGEDGSAHSSAGSAKKAAYEVGYGKPPRATQFKKGQSGNPKGAKKKEQIEDVRIMVEDVLAEPVKLRDGDKVVHISKLEAMLRTQRLNALKGDSKAAKAVFKLSQKTGMFSHAKPKSNIVIDPPGRSPEVRMLLRAFRAQHEYQSAEEPTEYDKSDVPQRNRG